MPEPHSLGDVASTYRPEIDGLRAIAVVPVVLYHIGLPGVTGGFIGVDVFFVISGYLITAILLKDIGTDQFSIVKFYERRIRRLLPALFAVLLFTICIAYFLLPPTPLKDFAQSLAATTVFSSNILFFLESGYFDSDAKLKLLLHTWSLAVEEQFYLVHPLLLLVLVRWRDRIGVVIPLMVLSVISFAAGMLVIGYDQSAAFYLLPFRAWELGLGAVLAAAGTWAIPARFSETFRLLGVLLILSGVIFISPSDLFPGWLALIPCVGSALIIAAGSPGSGWTYRCLASEPMVFIGKISYSLYLWHWPIVVAFRLGSANGDLEPVEKGLVFILSFLAATISWRFVETPFRTKRLLEDRNSLFKLAAGISFVWISLGVAGHVTGGFPDRLSERTNAVAVAAEDFTPFPPVCSEWPGERELCVLGSQSHVPTFMFWGDSHAGILSNGIHEQAVRRGVSGLYSGVGGCPPLFGIDKEENSASGRDNAACAIRNRQIQQVLSEESSIDTVILVGRWSYYAEGEGVGIDRENQVSISPTDPASPSSGSSREVFRHALLETLRTLQGYGLKVHLLEQVPEIPRFTSAVFLSHLMRNDSNTSELESMSQIEKSVVAARQTVFSDVVGSAEFPKDVEVIQTHHLFCGKDYCSALDEGSPVYFDNNHVTTSMAVRMGVLFDHAVRRNEG